MGVVHPGHGTRESSVYKGRRCDFCLPSRTAGDHQKNEKRKAGSALVPSWQEPSTLLLEWCLAQDASLSLALHLSNLQRVALDRWQGSPTHPAGTPRILPISDTRGLYTILCQAQNKIEEALARFGGGGLILWVPEGGEQLPRILSAILKLHERGISLYVQFLVPFFPLPGCESPDLILDLWGHPLLHPKYHNMLRSITFLKEASKCVFTRDDNPIYSTKNVVSIGVQAGTGGVCPRMLSIKEDLILEGLQGEFIYVDSQPVMEPRSDRSSTCSALRSPTSHKSGGWGSEAGHALESTPGKQFWGTHRKLPTWRPEPLLSKSCIVFATLNL